MMRLSRSSWLRRAAFLAALTPIGAAGCAASGEDVGIEALAIDDSPEEDAADDTPDYDVKRYDLRAELDWERHRLVGTVGITLRLAAGAGSSIALGSAVSEIRGVRLADGGPLRFTVDAAHRSLRVDLPPHARGEKKLLKLEITYETDAIVASEGTEDVSNSLYMMPALAGDPVPVRTVVTVSEPDNAIRWLPCHDVPTDRAVFSVDLRLPESETLIANGNFVFDRPAGKGHHRIKYDSGVTLPTYVMSFAAGNFEVETRIRGALPVSIWHRRGLPADYDRAFAETFRGLDVYESLFGAYPFSTYATVFAQLGWGMENATMSLIGERSMAYGLGPNSTIGLHELSHQWFGNLVTNASWDDKWFKEGMATALEVESQRIYLDQSAKHTLGGDRRSPRSGIAVRDPAVDPKHKSPYGAYVRGSWVLTQIRSAVGDDAFFDVLKKVLRQYRFSAIGTDAFVDAFAPYLGPDLTASVRKAVDAKPLPRLDVVRAPSGAGVFLTLHDADGSLVAPVALRWVAEDGSTRDQVLELDRRVEVAPHGAGEFLIVDPRDVHPDLSVFAAEAGPESAKNYQEALLPLLVPKGERAVARWLADAGGAHQLAVLSKAWPGIAPEAFPRFVKELDAESAKALALQWACVVAADPKLEPATRAAWSKVIARTLSEPAPMMGISSLGSKRYAACSKVVDIEEIFADEWSKLESDPTSAEVPYTRLVYLSRFQLPPARSFSVWSGVTKNANSLTAREQAAGTLARDAARAAPADAPAWRAFFARLLSESQSDSVLYAAIDGGLATQGASPGENADFVAGLNAVLHDPLDYWDGHVHSYALCAAFRLMDDSSDWQRFVDGLADAGLRPDIRALAANPSRCDSVLP